ncbi:thiol:disulfide interchange protein DsbG [Agrobacterium leguminum]|uniref:Thiol:disulfide interchange protein n=1 Tax=Agrobacterium deltaense NCPPB 1641 TaxID=1183425 RepID=A0A1S7TJ65_9HYPH|nr:MULTISPECIES: thiol:disulfide interchange protein DsbG [Agrobacterium]WFS65085.1 thiol:disulfide interchange protein DsbG [Agrobacterium leguminum]CVI54369.1 Thiol:disulfide interchange protein DsbG [Agrobacterium deltaense NCPPB 1641]
MPYNYLTRNFPVAAFLSSLLLVSPSVAQDAAKNGSNDGLPEILRSIELQGIRILGEMDVPGGLRGFAAKAGAQPIAIYLTPDNKHVVVGTLVDATGRDMAAAQMKKVVEKPILEDGRNQLSQSTWVQDGKADAPRIVYTFTDPNCPYCNKFWQAARPWINSGKVQLRHIMVGVIRQDSPAKAAAILEARSPSEALKENELKHKDGGIAPLQSVKEQTTASLDRNANLMTELGFGGTPAIIFKKADGTIGTVAGMPQDSALEIILGPR